MVTTRQTTVGYYQTVNALMWCTEWNGVDFASCFAEGSTNVTYLLQVADVFQLNMHWA